MPPRPEHEDIEEGVVRGGYLLEPASGSGQRVNLLGSGTILFEVLGLCLETISRCHFLNNHPLGHVSLLSIDCVNPTLALQRAGSVAPRPERQQCAALQTSGTRELTGGISNRRRIDFKVRSQCLTTLTEPETISAKCDEATGKPAGNHSR